MTGFDPNKKLYAALVSRDEIKYSLIDVYNGMIIAGSDTGCRFQIPTNRMSDLKTETVLYGAWLYITDTKEDAYAYTSIKLQEMVKRFEDRIKAVEVLNQEVISKLNTA
jgi:hypothetical protein